MIEEKEEIWKDIKDYKNLYQVSSFGRVKSLNYRCTRKENILMQRKDRGGYLIVDLCKNGKRKAMLVHRLVCDAFLSNPLNLPQVNHKDECKTNNNVENLEYCTAKYNSNYGSHNKKIAKALTGCYNNKTSKQVKCLETGKIYPSAMEIHRKLGFSHSHISACCRGEYKSAYKLHWQYV